MIKDKDFLIWFAGFFDGDGWVGTRKTGNRNPEYCLGIGQIADNNGKRVMKEIQRVFGGNVYLYKPRKKNHRPVWYWQLNKRRHVSEILGLLIPYLRVKKKKAIKIKGEIDSLPRAGAHWTVAEERELGNLLKAGKSWREIAEILVRSRSAVYMKVHNQKTK